MGGDETLAPALVPVAGGSQKQNFLLRLTEIEKSASSNSAMQNGFIMRIQMVKNHE